MSPHPRHDLDDLLNSPVRFSIMAALAAAEKAEFSAVRDAVEITDSALSKQAASLESAGYVKVTKTWVNKRGRTWLALTRPGRKAFETHVATLRRIADGAADLPP